MKKQQNNRGAKNAQISGNTGKRFIPQNTAMVMAGICLLVGFLLGTVFSGLFTGKDGYIRKYRETDLSQGKKTPSTVGTEDLIHRLKEEATSHPLNISLWAKLGNACFDAGRYDEAISAYSQYLDLNPQNADIWTDLGVMYRRTGSPEKAIYAFDRAIKLHPGHQQSRFNKGIVLMNDLRNLTGAIDAWQELLKINPVAQAPDGRPLEFLIRELGKKVKEDHATDPFDHTQQIQKK